MATAHQRDTATTRVATAQLDRSHGSYELVVSPVILGLLGWWIDGRAGTSPLFLVVLAAVGVAGAATKLYYQYRTTVSADLAGAAATREARAAERRTAERAERERADAELRRQMAEAEAALDAGLRRTDVAAEPQAATR